MKVIKKWIANNKPFLKTKTNNQNMFWLFNDFKNQFEEIKYIDFEKWKFIKTGKIISKKDDSFTEMRREVTDLLAWLQCDATEADIY